MNKSEIEEELISKLKIELKETLFYMPGETLTGMIKLQPGIKLKIKDNKLHLNKKFIQYEFWEYNNIKIDELKNIYKTELDSKDIEYTLKEEELQDFEENKKFGNFSIIFIEKEEEQIISIPFEFKISEQNTNLLSTFQFETDECILGIRHLLMVECKEYNAINHIGLFIGKKRDNNFIESKTFNEKYETLLDKIDVEIKFPTLSFYMGEKINFDFKSNSTHTFGRSWSFQQVLYRKIEQIGYLKNSLLDKTILNDNSISELKYKKEIDKDDINLTEAMVIGLLTPLIFGIYGAVSGGLLGSLGAGLISMSPKLLLGTFFGGVVGNFGGIGTVLIYSLYSPEDIQFSDKYMIKTSNENNINEKIKEEIKKFVYFKDNKIVGFIKFKENFTPPIKGHYFKCNFNLKIDASIPGLILSSDNKKSIKTKIGFYDSENYIKEMKKLLSLN